MEKNIRKLEALSDQGTLSGCISVPGTIMSFKVHDETGDEITSQSNKAVTTKAGTFKVQGNGDWTLKTLKEIDKPLHFSCKTRKEEFFFELHIVQAKKIKPRR